MVNAAAPSTRWRLFRSASRRPPHEYVLIMATHTPASRRRLRLWPFAWPPSRRGAYRRSPIARKAGVMVLLVFSRLTFCRHPFSGVFFAALLQLKMRFSFFLFRKVFSIPFNQRPCAR